MKHYEQISESSESDKESPLKRAKTILKKSQNRSKEKKLQITKTKLHKIFHEAQINISERLHRKGHAHKNLLKDLFLTFNKMKEQMF